MIIHYDRDTKRNAQLLRKNMTRQERHLWYDFLKCYPDNTEEITNIENGVWIAYNGDAVDLTVWSTYDEIRVSALGDGLFTGSQTNRSFYPHHCGWFTTNGSAGNAETLGKRRTDYLRPHRRSI